jgi:hypothetical protein
LSSARERLHRGLLLLLLLTSKQQHAAQGEENKAAAEMIEIELASEHKEKNRAVARRDDDGVAENQLVAPGDVITR